MGRVQPISLYHIIWLLGVHIAKKISTTLGVKLLNVGCLLNNKKNVKMKLIRTIPYGQTKFKFISSHYNLHLQGLCIYEKEVCYFQTLEGDFNEEKDEWDESFCQIYKLSFKEKVNWLFRQKKFEWMVGYHWTYPYRKTGERQFHYRKPQWLYKFLFSLFYKRC